MFLVLLGVSTKRKFERRTGGNAVQVYFLSIWKTKYTLLGFRFAYYMAVIRARWDQFKISIYQLFLYLYFTRIGVLSRRMLT